MSSSNGGLRDQEDHMQTQEEQAAEAAVLGACAVLRGRACWRHTARDPLSVTAVMYAVCLSAKHASLRSQVGNAPIWSGCGTFQLYHTALLHLDVHTYALAEPTVLCMLQKAINEMFMIMSLRFIAPLAASVTGKVLIIAMTERV